MENYNIVSELRNYCEINNILFIYGKDEYANMQISVSKIPANKLVLVCDFDLEANFDSSITSLIKYNGVFLFGFKQEVSTYSNLDETPIQKYDRRLHSLTTLGDLHLKSFACSNDLLLTSARISFVLNKFDAVLDFVQFTATIEQ